TCITVYHRPAAAAFDRICITTPSLPGDRPAAFEFERRCLRVGELPVVVEVVAAARGGDAHRMIDAEGPAGDVNLMRAVVADLARAPAAEPMPVVVNHVVAVGRARRRPLPQLVIEVSRCRRGLAPPDGRAAVRIPGAGEVRTTDDPIPDRLHGLDRSG